MSWKDNGRLIGIAALLTGAVHSPSTVYANENAGSPCAATNGEILSHARNIEVQIVDKSGVRPLELEKAAIATFSPKIGFIYGIKDVFVACQIVWGLDQIKAYATPGVPKMLDEPRESYAEEKPENEIPITLMVYGEDGFFVQARDDASFPEGSQISLVIPLSENPKVNFVIRTYTQPHYPAPHIRNII